MTIVVLVVVIVIVGGAIGLYFLVASSPVVTVTGINVYAPDDVCGLATFPGYYGFNDTPGANLPLELPLTNSNTTSCTIRGVVTNTSGFSITDAVVPLTIQGGAAGTLNLTLVLPSGAYNGLLNLVFS